MTILVTGAAGFIGYHVSQALLGRGEQVLGVDNFSPYYDVRLKQARLDRLHTLPGFRFQELDIADREGVTALLAGEKGVTGVIHLAAQAGVRHSLIDPYTYIQTNLMGQVVLLEAARHLPGLRHFVYASSSSVYGGNQETPFSTDHRVDRPVSLYAATKRADELITRTYSHLYGLPATGLRFFTVYGPWGRPDMAAFLFADAILEGRPIRVFNHGNMARDFTYIDDIVDGILAALDRPATPGQDVAPHRIYNLGNHRPEPLGRFIGLIEQALGRKAELRLEPLQPGDVPETCADIADSTRDLGYQPRVGLDEGVSRFIDWFKAYRRAG